MDLISDIIHNFLYNIKDKKVNMHRFNRWYFSFIFLDMYALI